MGRIFSDHQCGQDLSYLAVAINSCVESVSGMIGYCHFWIGSLFLLGPGITEIAADGEWASEFLTTDQHASAVSEENSIDRFNVLHSDVRWAADYLDQSELGEW